MGEGEGKRDSKSTLQRKILAQLSKARGMCFEVSVLHSVKRDDQAGNLWV